MTDPVYLLEAVKKAAVTRLAAITNDVLDNEMRWVLCDFLKGTLIWKRNLTITLVTGQSDYVVPIQDYESVAFVERVAYGATAIRLGTIPYTYATTGQPQVAGLIDDRTLRVFPTPSADATESLSVLVCMTVLVTSNQPPPDVVRPYHDVLLDGLLMRCFAIPDRPWSNVRLAPAHAQAYEAGKVNVRRERDGGRVHGAQFMKIPRF
jgi:hypothetical protein